MDNLDLKWYVIHTTSGYESVVLENLKKMVTNNKLQDFIAEIVMPMEEDIVERNGKRKKVERKKFPSYLFMKMKYTKEIGYLVINTTGVTGFVGPVGTPIPLTNDEVKRIGLEKIEIKDINYNVGDHIKVVTGALESFIGEITEINIDRQKVKVNISMFGRLTPVELDFNQIEKI